MTNTASLPVGPISAIEWTWRESGRAPLSFLSSTVPASATCVATCWCCGVETSGGGFVWGATGLSNTPESNIANRMRCAMSSNREAGICVKSGIWAGAFGSCVRSTPASAAGVGFLTAKPKSGTTNPWRPPGRLRSPSVVGFSQLGTPLIWL